MSLHKRTEEITAAIQGMTPLSDDDVLAIMRCGRDFSNIAYIATLQKAWRELSRRIKIVDDELRDIKTQLPPHELDRR